MKTAIIIGGGASGIAAALRLAAICPELPITVLEKNDRILKKLLTTGNGKCNITNTGVTAGLYESVTAKKVIQSYDFERVRRFLAQQGLPVKADQNGRCYPLSESAKNAVNILLNALAQSHIRVITNAPVSHIKKENGVFYINAGETYKADFLICAIGSAAAVKGYNGTDLLHNLHIPFTQPTPALCPLPSEEAFLKALKGVRAKGIVSLQHHHENGEIQFNEKNVSGICVFNLSRYVQANDRLYIDFSQGCYGKAELASLIAQRALHCSENAAILDFLLLRKLALVVLKRAGIKPSGSPAALSKTDIDAIVEQILHFSVQVSAPTDFKTAQTVCGGLNETAVNPRTLESNTYENLYFCGEIIDADAPCGGFNLHWAWASGMCVADAVYQSLTGGTYID